MWGAGTALGELPPYFMARAARLSSLKPHRSGRRRSTTKIDDIESLAELQALQQKQQNPEQLVCSASTIKFYHLISFLRYPTFTFYSPF